MREKFHAVVAAEVRRGVKSMFIHMMKMPVMLFYIKDKMSVMRQNSTISNQ